MHRSDFLWPFNLLSLAIGLSGLLAGYYFFKAAQPSAVVNYVTKTIVVAQLDNSEFQLYRAGTEIEVRSMYRTDIGLWNAGTVPIEQSSIRRPLTIEFSDPSRIFDAKLVQASHSVAGFAITPDGQRQIRASWDYFDPGFFLVVQIFHSEDVSPQLSLRYISDQNIMRHTPPQIRDLPWGEVALTIPMLIIPIIGLSWLVLLKRVDNTIAVRGWHTSAHMLLYLFGVIILIMGFTVGVRWVVTDWPNIIRWSLNLDVPVELGDRFDIR